MIAAHHAHAHAADMLAGTNGEIAFGIALAALVIIIVSRRRSDSSVRLTEIALVAAAGFCTFWPGFHHAKPGPRIVVFIVLALLILVLRSMFRHAVKGGQKEAAPARRSGFYPAPAVKSAGRKAGR